MGEFEDRLSSLMNDPKQMEEIAAMAKSLMGGEDRSGGAGAGAEGPDLDPGMLQKLAGILGKTGTKTSEQTALLNAMKPYLSEKRRTKMEKAMKLARIAEIAELAAGEIGGDGDV